jgi:hypothetical protein
MPIKPLALLSLLGATAVLILVSGCSTSSGSATGSSITLTPRIQQFCDAGQSLPFNASVANDPANKGVTWSLAGGGSLTSITPTNVIYNAPASVTATMTATLTATSAAGGSAVATTTIVVSPPPAISTSSLSNATAGTAYTAALQATGGVAPYNWILSSGSTLPAGLSLNASIGIISGTPAANGASTFTVTLTDFSTPQLSTTKTLSLIVGQTLSIASSSTPNGEFGVAYPATTLAATGGSAPYSWSVVAGTLPTGLTLSRTGVLSGTPAGSGSYSFTAQVADAGSPQQTATKPFSFTIAPQLVITNTSLPSVAVNNTYNVSLAATGGIGSDTWNLAAGSTLPAGLTLSPAGVLSGTPAAPATTTFTVQATDAGTPPQTATQQLTLIVSPALSVTTTTLPGAAAGSPYSATLLSLGGTAPVMWSIVPPSALPAGLTLNAASGSISGTPQTAGPFNFSVKATDASTPQQTATQVLSLIVSAPTPLSITTAGLPAGIAGTSYSATLTATGGVAPLTWSLSAGTLPAGLSLNSSTGLISGTPSTSGITTFTAQVADSATPAVTATKQYKLTVNGTLGSGVNNTQLKGSYAFLFNGFISGNTPGRVYGVAAIGTLTADGNGNVTGAEDLNSSDGEQTQLPLTGQYAIGSDNRGTLVINNGSSLTTYAVSTSSISSGVAQQLNFVEFDNAAPTASGTVGTGIAKLQTPASFTASTVKGSFVFGLQGETPCNTCASPATPYGPVAAAGILTVDGSGNLTGQQDSGAMNTAYTGTTLNGTYTSPAAGNGRGTLTVTATGSLYPAPPAGFVYYIVNANEMFLMSIDSHANSTLLSGDAQLQRQATFTGSSPSGTVILYESNANGGDGVSAYPSASNATLAMMTITGTGTASLSEDVNRAGVFSTSSPSAITYVVATNGRTTLSIGGGSGPVLYLFDNTSGFGVDLPQAGTAPGLIHAEPQTITTAFPAFLTGKFSVATLPGSVSANMVSGTATLTPNTGGLDAGGVSGAGSFLLDSSSPSGNLLSGQTSSVLYVEAATGRIPVTAPGSGAVASVIYAISPSKAVQISTGANATPSVSVLER